MTVVKLGVIYFTQNGASCQTSNASISFNALTPGLQTMENN